MTWPTPVERVSSIAELAATVTCSPMLPTVRVRSSVGLVLTCRTMPSWTRVLKPSQRHLQLVGTDRKVREHERAVDTRRHRPGHRGIRFDDGDRRAWKHAATRILDHTGQLRTGDRLRRRHGRQQPHQHGAKNRAYRLHSHLRLPGTDAVKGEEEKGEATVVGCEAAFLPSPFSLVPSPLTGRVSIHPANPAGKVASAAAGRYAVTVALRLQPLKSRGFRGVSGFARRFR